jgi:hypothetical protein
MDVLSELEKIKISIHKKGGVKLSDKVNQRIGQAKLKHPSAQERYDINRTNDPTNKQSSK